MPLNHVFELYFPTKCRCGEPILENVRSRELDNLYKKMANWFGGGTLIRTEGFWLSSDIGLVAEDVDVIFSNSNAQAYIDHYDEFLEYAANLANFLTQETIACLGFKAEPPGFVDYGDERLFCPREYGIHVFSRQGGLSHSLESRDRAMCSCINNPSFDRAFSSQYNTESRVSGVDIKRVESCVRVVRDLDAVCAHR